MRIRLDGDEEDVLGKTIWDDDVVWIRCKRSMSEEQLGDGKHWGLDMCRSWHGFSHLRKIPGFLFGVYLAMCIWIG